MKEMKTTAQVLVDCLEAEGVDVMFGIPGEETLDLMFAIRDSKIRFIPVRHEQGAAFMADVYGRLTGRAGVCLSTLGPGATNLVTGVADAYLDGAPLVAITGQVGTDRMQLTSHQYLDLTAMFEPITKRSKQIIRPDTVGEIVRLAFKHAEKGKPGATHIDLPQNIAKMPADAVPLKRQQMHEVYADPTHIAAAGKIISEAKDPVILAGAGAVRGHAAAAVTELADRLHIPVVNTMMAKGIIPMDDKYSLWTIGIPQKDYVNQLFDRADVVIAIGYDIVECAPARDYGKMKTIVSTSLISFLVLSVLLGFFGFFFSHSMMSLLQTPADILDEAVLYLRVYFVGFPFLFMYNILSTMFTSIGESRIPLGLLIFSSVLNIFMDLWMVAGLDLGVFGAALATLIAQGISAVFSLLIFLSRMRRYKSRFEWFDRHELHSMLRIAVPSVLQQSTVSIGMMIVQAVVNPFGTQALAGYSATMRVENVFSLIFVSIGNAVSPFVSQNLGAKKTERIKKGYHAALVLDLCFAVLAFIVIETLHTQISSLFLGKDGTALAYQVSGDYMRWLGFFFIFMGIKMATDGVLRGLGIMRPFLAANMVNLAIRLSVALICAPRFGIAFVWLAVPAGWLANFLISYVALRKSWPAE